MSRASADCFGNLCTSIDSRHISSAMVAVVMTEEERIPGIIGVVLEDAQCLEAMCPQERGKSSVSP